MKKAIVVLSGGQDSTTCLFWALEQGYSVHAVTFDYGQRHAIEIEAATRVLAIATKLYEQADITSEVIELGEVLEGTSPLVSANPLEQYKDMHSLPGGLEKTFVPMRNQMFLTIAMNRAVVYGAEAVITGVCQEDFGGYPDCRQIFISSLVTTCYLGTSTGVDGFQPIEILTPLMNLSKADSVHLAFSIFGCYTALAFSHTSYDGQYPPIGKDHATLLREKGFAEAGIPDPLVLRAHREGLMALPATDNYHSDIIKLYLDTLNQEYPYVW